MPHLQGIWRGRRARTRPQVRPLRRKRRRQKRRHPLPFLRWKRLGFPLEGLNATSVLAHRRHHSWREAAFANFLVTTATRESFFDGRSAPIGLILIIVGGYFLMKDWD